MYKLFLSSIFTVACFCVIIGVVGIMDYEDEVQELARYCDMVSSHTWPDYKGIYVQECLKNS